MKMKLKIFLLLGCLCIAAPTLAATYYARSVGECENIQANFYRDKSSYEILRVEQKSKASKSWKEFNEWKKTQSYLRQKLAIEKQVSDEASRVLQTCQSHFRSSSKVFQFRYVNN